MIYTATPGNTVGAANDQPAVYSSSPALDTGFGTDRTPIDWPTTGNVTAVEVDLTAVTDFGGDGDVQVGVATPASLAPLTGATSDASGTFSGWGGTLAQYRTGGTDALYLDKFGGWATDYLSVDTSSTSGNSVFTPVSGGIPTGTVTTAVDLRGSIRLAGARSSDRGTIVAVMSQADLYVTTTGIGLGIIKDGTVTQQRLEVSWATAGISWNTWHDIRGTWSVTDGLKLYVDGTLVGSVATDGTGATGFANPNGIMRAGNGANASAFFGAGLGGDYRDVSIAATIGGTPFVELNLNQMDSSTDTSWPSGYSGVNWTRNSGVTVHGSTVADTKTVRIDLDSACPLTDFRFIVDGQTGTLTVDEIRLELQGGGIYVDGAVHF